MPGPKRKLFGSLNLDGIKKVVTDVPNKVGEYKGEKQIKVTAAQWEDDGISIEVWDAEKKESIKIGNLRVSTLDGNSSPQPAAAESNDGPDLPF